MAAPEVVGATEPDVVARAARVLRAGGLVVLPTDTVYGLAASLDSPEALARIFEAKRRPRQTPLPVLIASAADAGRLAAGPLSSPVMALVGEFWPGPLTVVVEAGHRLPGVVTAGLGTVGLRVPDNEVAREIIGACGGALVVTSANLSGEDSPRAVSDIPHELLAHVSLVVDGGPCPGGVPSTVVDITGPEPRVLREGAVPAAAIEAALGRRLAAGGAEL
ncbi:MAG TPA: L-threonylcarbamoyladenylate synthase [Armatimonadota bacterium]|nr:L-threonylcarbamoyladenylate synthase [Armatimonadota bacterium]